MSKLCVFLDEGRQAVSVLLDSWWLRGDSWNWSVDIRLDVSGTAWDSYFSDWVVSRNVQTLLHFSFTIVSIIWSKINRGWLDQWIFTVVSLWFIMLCQIVILTLSFGMKVDLCAWHWSWNPILLCWRFFTWEFLVWGICDLFE